ncbi:hypothetical protein PO79_09185 [Vibrio parahaemolyticus]|nr:hypothetical protein PO79_09185 [Vibrio parahaemolyticus]
MVEVIIENIKWIFSGCGVVIISTIVMYHRKNKMKSLDRKLKSSTVNIKSGNSSNNIVSSGDVTLTIKKDK